MAFEKIRLGVEEIFIIIVQDQNTGKEKEKWTSMKRDFHKVVRILDNKYGLNIYKAKERDKELDWAIQIIDIYKTFTCSLFMKLKDYLGKIITNKRNGQLNVSLKKGQLKKAGISKEQLFNMEVNLKSLLEEE